MCSASIPIFVVFLVVTVVGTPLMVATPGNPHKEVKIDLKKLPFFMFGQARQLSESVEQAYKCLASIGLMTDDEANEMIRLFSLHGMDHLQTNNRSDKYIKEGAARIDADPRVHFYFSKLLPYIYEVLACTHSKDGKWPHGKYTPRSLSSHVPQYDVA